MPTNDDEMQADDGSEYEYEDDNASQDKLSSENNSVTDDVEPTTLGKVKTEYFANPGETLTLQCQVINKGKSLVIWYKGENIITQDKTIINNKFTRYSFDEDSLIIKDIEESDQDHYKCEILPSRISLKVKLMVSKPPTIRILMENRDVTRQQLSFREGDMIRLDCQSEEHPQPKYIWSLNGTRLDKQHGVVVNQGVLVIESAQSHHSDHFQCLADNGHGVTHQSVNIHIDCK